MNTQQLLGTYYLPKILQDTMKTRVNQTDKNPCPYLGRGQRRTEQMHTGKTCAKLLYGNKL